MSITLVLSISILLQVTAASLALYLIWITGKRTAWILISTAVFFMAIRRGILLFHYIFEDTPHSADITAELVALAISLLMLVGIARIIPIFVSIKNSEETLRKSEAELRKTQRALQCLSDCNQAMVRTTEESDLLDEICCNIVDTGGYRMAWVGFSEQDKGKTVLPAAKAGCEEGYLENIKISWEDNEFGRGPTDMAIRTGKPIINKDIMKNPNYAPWKTKAIKHGFASSIALPLIAADQTLGALNVYASEPDAFDEKEVELLMELAGDLSYGIMALRTQAEKKQAEEELKESEARYRYLFEKAPISIILLEKDGKMADVNPYHISQIGKNRTTKKDYIGKNIVMYPSVVNAGLSEKYEALLRGKPFDVKGVYFPTTSGGTEAYLNVKGVPLFKDGKVFGAISIHEDITELKQMEKAFRKSEERYRSLTKTARDAIILADNDGKIISWNNGARAIFGYKEKEVLDKPLTMLMPERYRNAHANGITQTKSTNKFKMMGKTVELQGLKKNKREFPIEISFSNWKAGKDIFYSGIIRDLSERRQAEEKTKEQQQQLIQADKMKTLGILVAGVAHEINNPNTLIKINIPVLFDIWNGTIPILEKYFKEHGDFALGGFPYIEVRKSLPKLLSGVLSGSHQIDNIVKKLKNFTQYDPQNRKKIDINGVVKEAVELTDSLIKKSTTAFSVEYADNLPKVIGNFQELEQVIVNLITNSCQALPDKKKGIHIHTSYDVKSKKVLVTISDKGIGISARHLKMIMDPFFTTKRDSGGTGLGLSISFNIIKVHNGTLEFSSEEGKGTKAKVVLPVAG